MLRFAKRRPDPNPLMLTPREWRASREVLRLRAESERRWRWPRRLVVLAAFVLIGLAAPAARAEPPSWWPWPTWLPGSGYMPVTRSPRVLAGSHD